MDVIDGKTQRLNIGVVVIGFGTTVCIWAVAYVCRMPPVIVPGQLLLLFFVACFLCGGFFAGRYASGGLLSGIFTGLIVSALNVAILGSLLGGDRPNVIRPSAAWWLPGFVLLGTVLGAAGGALGNASPRAAARRNWTQAFACVAAAATLLLLSVGGLVTSNRAGLAVVDWPNTYGYNIFLYPLSRMSGGIYYEHAHRLFGSLVGLTMLVFVIHLLRTDDRKRVRTFALLALAMVAVQGVIGGLRVTGGFTLSTRPGDMAPSIFLAIVHGVTGQLFFSALVAICVVVSTTWRGGAARRVTRRASTELFISGALCALLSIQVVLGSIVRHLSAGLLIHVAVAITAAALALACGARAWGLYREIPALRRTGVALMILAALQLFLGFMAAIASGAAAEGNPVAEFRVVFTTIHQMSGALLLGCSVMLFLWNRRFLAPQECAKISCVFLLIVLEYGLSGGIKRGHFKPTTRRRKTG